MKLIIYKQYNLSTHFKIFLIFTGRSGEYSVDCFNKSAAACLSCLKSDTLVARNNLSGEVVSTNDFTFQVLDLSDKSENDFDGRPRQSTGSFSFCDKTNLVFNHSSFLVINVVAVRFTATHLRFSVVTNPIILLFKIISYFSSIE